MSKKRDKELKKIAQNAVNVLIDYFMSVDIEYREAAINAAFIANLNIIKDTFGDDYVKACLLETMFKMDVMPPVRPQSETLH